MILGLLLSSCLKNSVETVILSVCECEYTCVFRDFREKELQSVSEALQWL